MIGTRCFHPSIHPSIWQMRLVGCALAVVLLRSLLRPALQGAGDAPVQCSTVQYCTYVQRPTVPKGKKKKRGSL